MSIVLNDCLYSRTYNKRTRTHTHTQTGYREFTEVFRRILYRHICMRNENQYVHTNTLTSLCGSDRKEKKEKTVNHIFLPRFGIYICI